jgi:hypothetical protein
MKAGVEFCSSYLPVSDKAAKTGVQLAVGPTYLSYEMSRYIFCPLHSVMSDSNRALNVYVVETSDTASSDKLL